MRNAMASKSTLLAMTVIGMLAIIAVNQTSFADELSEEEDIVPGEIIVKFKSVGTSLHPAASAPLGFNIVGSTSSGAMKLKIDPANPDASQGYKALKEKTIEAADTLSRMNHVEYAHPNYRVRPQARLSEEPDDPRYVDQWAFHDVDRAPGGIGLTKLWALTTGDNTVVVAVLDTGITKDNEDIDPAVLVEGFDFVKRPEDSMDGDGRDRDPSDVDFSDGCIKESPLSQWHGTQVASLIGAVRSNNKKGMAGINWNIKIQPLRVMGPCGGSIDDVADAIRWAAGISVDGVPDNGTPARIINLSMEGAASCSKITELQSAITDAVKAGAIIVTAAGNYRRDVSRTYPAGCLGVVAVAASDINGNLASYSGYGPGVTIMAPGGDFNGNPAKTGVLTAIRRDYHYNKGTSFSAPIVSGVLALWLAARPSLSNEELIAIMKKASKRRDSVQCPLLCGAGLLNAFPFASMPIVP